MKTLINLVLLISASSLFAQINPVEYHWIQNGLGHSSVKSNTFYQIDSLGQDSISTIRFKAAPDVLGAYQNNLFKIRSGADLQLRVNWKQKLRLMTDYRVGYSNQELNPYQSLLQSKAFLNTDLGNGQTLYHDLRGRMVYEPNKYIQFQAGLDHLFIGEGDRSLLMGNQGIPSPFASMRAKLWRLEYHFMQQIWREKTNDQFSPKANSSHYLSYKVNKNWSVGIFETVVYDMRDTLYNRGIEIEYLNPFIFYRPQEYSIGSTDNVLIGFQTSYQWKRNMFYGQVVLDEFSLLEIKARKRWWANKYGFQLGYKTSFEKNMQAYFIRSEFNLIRPFTYSQINPNSVYGNQYLPVAHPLGAGFVEFYQEVSVRRKDWNFSVWAQVYLKGMDTIYSNIAFGGDIYKPYTQRPEEYNFNIGRGITYHALQIGLHVSKTIYQDWEAFIEPRFIFSNTEGNQLNKTQLTVGIHRRLGSDKRNY
ncbi:MAG: hypothetical protein PHQ74_02125 [Crocinitomicaceae bacterium]|nr:hypothetical protein [Crocinitomicaceae bacterium]